MTQRRWLDLGFLGALLLGGAVLVRSWDAEPPVESRRKAEKKGRPPIRSLRAPVDLSAETMPVDLLTRIDPAQDAAHGEWTREGDFLLSPAQPWARLQVPVRPPADYRLELEVRRISGGDSLNLGLSDGRRQCMVVLDGNGGKHSGLDLVAGKGFSQNPTTVHKRVFADTQPKAIRVRVRPGRIDVDVDGQPLIAWAGEFEQLGVLPPWSVHGRQTLFLGAYGTRFEVRKLTLTPSPGD